VTSICFHPSVKNVLFSASNDLGRPNVKIWNIIKGEQLKMFSVIPDILNMAVNYAGDRLALLNKNGTLNLYDLSSWGTLKQVSTEKFFFIYFFFFWGD